MAWSEQTGTSTTYYVKNPTETTWDGGSTFWDLSGNVYQTLWDNIDDTWAAASTTSAIWTEQ